MESSMLDSSNFLPNVLHSLNLDTQTILSVLSDHQKLISCSQDLSKESVLLETLGNYIDDNVTEFLKKNEFSIRDWLKTQQKSCERIETPSTHSRSNSFENLIFAEEENIPEASDDEEEEIRTNHYRRRRLVDEDTAKSSSRKSREPTPELHQIMDKPNYGEKQVAEPKQMKQEVSVLHFKPRQPEEKYPLETKKRSDPPSSCSKAIPNPQLNYPQNYLYFQYMTTFPYGYYGCVPNFIPNMTPLTQYQYPGSDVSNLTSTFSVGKPLPPVTTNSPSTVDASSNPDSSSISDAHKKIKLNNSDYRRVIPPPPSKENPHLAQNQNQANIIEPTCNFKDRKLSNQSKKRFLQANDRILDEEKKGDDGTEQVVDDSCVVLLRNVPKLFNTVELLNKNFKKFGLVINIQCDAANDTAKVQFRTQAEALKSAEFYSKPGVKLNVFGDDKVQVLTKASPSTASRTSSSDIRSTISNKLKNISQDSNFSNQKTQKSNSNMKVNANNISTKLTEALRKLIEERNSTDNTDKKKTYEMKIKNVKSALVEWNTQKNLENVREFLMELEGVL